MKKLLLPLFLLPFCSFAQTPVVQWMHTMGGSGNESARSVIQTSDGGYLTAGASNSMDGDVTGNHNSQDMWLVKFDAGGNYQWQKNYGGSGSDWADTIIPTADGGYAAAGGTISNDGDASGNTNHGFWMVKLATDGSLTWQRSYGNGAGQAFTRQMIRSADGGYVLAGLTQANGGDVTGFHGEFDFWVIKLDANGNLVWQKDLGGSVDDQANTVQQTPDGGYIVGGWTSSNDGDVTDMQGCYDGWLVKLSANGEMEWQKTMGTQNCEIINDIKLLPDDGYIYVGYRGYDALVVRTDAQANVIWEHQLGGTAQDEFKSISLTTDGGYSVSGFTHSIDGDLAGAPGEGRAWFVRLDANGEILWQRKLGGNGMIDYGLDFKEIADGQYIVCGSIFSDSDGNPNNEEESDMFIARLVPENMGTNGLSVPTAVTWPNPATSTITISLTDGITPQSITVSDSAGRTIGIYQDSSIGISGLANGVYFVSIKAEGKVYNTKFIKQ